jgi:hypothetical protein
MGWVNEELRSFARKNLPQLLGENPGGREPRHRGSLPKIGMLFARHDLFARYDRRDVREAMPKAIAFAATIGSYATGLYTRNTPRLKLISFFVGTVSQKNWMGQNLAHFEILGAL